MKKAVIFDMDGVIIQSEILYQERRNVFFRENGITVDDAFQKAVIGSNPIDMFSLLFPDSRDKQKLMLSKYNLFKDNYTIDYQSIVTKNMRETLVWLESNGYRIALASSGEYDILVNILESIGFKQYFEVIVSAADMAKSKPAPYVYLEVLERLNLKAVDCVAIEDSTHGIESATSAGIDCLALKPSDYDVDQQKATKIIESLSEIPKWLST